MIGVDSTFLIDVISRQINLKKIPDTAKLAVTSEVHFEFLCGAKPKERAILEEIESQGVQLTPSFQSSERAAEIWKSLRNKGKEIGKFDCLIAATYLENGITTILTNNHKHFEKIPGITCIEYYYGDKN
jgi:predicted nucleic acid-binding protein